MMLGFFRKNKGDANSSKNSIESGNSLTGIDPFMNLCLINITGTLDSIENPQDNVELFKSLLPLIQIDQDRIVLKYIDFVTKKGNHYNQDFIFTWLSKFYFLFDEQKKSAYYLGLIENFKRREYLSTELNDKKSNEIRNSEFAPPRNIVVPDDVMNFFSKSKTSDEIQEYISFQISTEEENTKSKDQRLWNLAYRFEKIVLYLIKQDKIEDALEFVEKFPAKAPKWTALSKLAVAMSKNRHQATDKLIKQIKDSNLKGSTIVRIALDQYSPNDYSMCLKTIQELSQSQNDFKNGFFVRLIEKLIYDGKVKEAIDILGKIEANHDSFTYDALVIIGTKMLYENKEDEAVSFTSLLKLPENKVKYLAALYCIYNTISKKDQYCINNYFLPERFVGHEIEFWKIFKNSYA